MNLRASAAALLLLAVLPSFASANLVWRVDDSADLTGWTVYNVKGSNGVRNHEQGGVLMDCEKDLYLMRAVTIDASQYDTLVVDLEVVAASSPSEKLCFYWASAGEAMGERTLVSAPLPKGWSGLVYVPLSTRESWQGSVANVRLDPIAGDGQVILRGIALVRDGSPSIRYEGRGGGPVMGVAPGPRRSAAPTRSPGAGTETIADARLLDAPPPRTPLANWDFVRMGHAGPWEFHDEGPTNRGTVRPATCDERGLTITASSIDPQLRLEGVPLNASDIECLSVEVQVEALRGSANAPKPGFGVYWSTGGDGIYRPSQAVTAPLRIGGGFQTLHIDLSQNPGWNGVIDGIRLDPASNAPVRATFRRIALY